MKQKPVVTLKLIVTSFFLIFSIVIKKKIKLYFNPV